MTDRSASTGRSSEEGELVIEGTVTCGACQLVQPAGTIACAECGAELADADEAWRSEANRELVQAYGWIAAVAWLYRLGALAYAIATLFAILALARTDVPERAGVLVVGLTTTLSVLMLMGAMLILFEPVLWTVAIALVATFVSVVHLVGPDPLGIAFLGSAAWAVVAWAALAPTLRFRRLVAHHKDRYILHHASARTRRALRGRTPVQRHERLLGAMRRAGRRAWKVSAGAAAVILLTSALATSLVVARLRPPLFSEAVARFEAAWNAGDLATVSQLFDPAVRATHGRRLEGWVDGHGWTGAPPALADGQQRNAGDRVWIDYPLDGFTLSASWHLKDRRWSLIDVELPVPAFEPTRERFLAAWRGSDPEALAQFFSPENRAIMRDSIETSARRRGWNEFPGVLDTRVTDETGGDVELVLVLERGKVTTAWHLRDDGSWHLNRLEMPRR